MPQASSPADRLVGLYVWAEATLLAGLQRILRLVQTLDPFIRAVTARRMVQNLANKVTRELDQQTPALIASLVAAETRAGAATPPAPPVGPPPAGGAAQAAPFPFDPGMTHGERAARQIANDLVSELSDVRYRITRLDDDVYKAIAPEGAINLVGDNGLTPKQAQAGAWRDFLRHGVTGFTDKSGRDWQLSSYVEMAVRTATTRAFNAARMEHAATTGVNLLFVSDDGHPCPLCMPWQNVVLAVTPDGSHPTVDDATAAGLFHPNCKHHLAEYIDGHTELPDPQAWTEQDQAQYNATQRQRYLEQAIRAAKRDALYAATPEARMAAVGDVRAAQAKMRAFLEKHGDLARRSHREQPDLSYPTTL